MRGIIIMSDGGLLLYHKSFAHNFGLGVGEADATCPPCKHCPASHTDQYRMGGLLFALQQFAACVTDAPTPLKCFTVQHTRLWFACAEGGLSVCVTASLELEEAWAQALCADVLDRVGGIVAATAPGRQPRAAAVHAAVSAAMEGAARKAALGAVAALPTSRWLFIRKVDAVVEGGGRQRSAVLGVHAPLAAFAKEDQVPSPPAFAGAAGAASLSRARGTSLPKLETPVRQPTTTHAAASEPPRRRWWHRFRRQRPGKPPPSQLPTTHTAAPKPPAAPSVIGVVAAGPTAAGSTVWLPEASSAAASIVALPEVGSPEKAHSKGAAMAPVTAAACSSQLAVVLAVADQALRAAPADAVSTALDGMFSRWTPPPAAPSAVTSPGSPVPVGDTTVALHGRGTLARTAPPPRPPPVVLPAGRGDAVCVTAVPDGGTVLAVVAVAGIQVVFQCPPGPTAAPAAAAWVDANFALVASAAQLVICAQECAARRR